MRSTRKAAADLDTVTALSPSGVDETEEAHVN